MQWGKNIEYSKYTKSQVVETNADLFRRNPFSFVSIVDFARLLPYLLDFFVFEGVATPGAGGSQRCAQFLTEEYLLSHLVDWRVHHSLTGGRKS